MSTRINYFRRFYKCLIKSFSRDRIKFYKFLFVEQFLYKLILKIQKDEIFSKP